MKKQVIIIGVTVLLLTIFLIGCTNNDSQSNEKVPYSYVVTGTDKDENYVYVDIQNIDTVEGDFIVDFKFTYIDPDMLGEHPDTGGTTDGNDEGIEHDSYTIIATISSHETERVSAPIRVPSGWEFGRWDYEVTPPMKNQ